MKTTLRPGKEMFATQRETLASICQRPRMADFSEMGAGKSLPQAVLAKGVIDDDLCDYVVIITPKAVLGDWQDIFRDFVPCDPAVLVLRYHGVPASLRKFVAFRPIIITTYEVIVAEFPKFLELFCNWRVMLVLDEAHRVRTPGTVRQLPSGKLEWKGSKRTAVCTALAHRARRFYPLTGTPIVNGLKNAYSYVNMLLPRQHYSSYDSFKNKHMVYRDRKVVQYKNVKELEDLIASVSVRRLKREVVDLPPVTYLRRELDWAPGQRSVYLKMLNDHVVEFADHWLEADEIGPRLTRLHQILTNPQQLGLDCDSTRWTVLDDDLESIGIAQHKVVVFAHYRASIKRLNARYSHLNPAVIFGGTADVDAQKSKFNEDPTCRIMFAHPKSAGLGINLSVANYCIFFEYSYDLDDYDQAVSRLDRPGQKSNVTVINYGVRGSMELNRILPALISKKQLSMALLRDPVEFMKFASITDEEE